MMKHKKLIITLSVLMCVLFVSVGVTLAYMTDNREKENTVTVGYDSIEIVEDFSTPAKQTQETTYKKEVKIRNNGNVPCYIRVYVDFSDSKIRDCSFFSVSDDINDTDSYFSASRDTINSDNYVNNLPEGWEFIPDNDSDTKLAGYYYYTNPVNVGESTPSLFTYIKTVYQSEDEIQQYDIIVYAESVQTIGQNGENINYKQAWIEFLV